MIPRLTSIFVATLAWLTPVQAGFDGDVTFSLKRPHPFTGTVPVTGRLTISLPDGEASDPIWMDAIYIFDDAPAVVAGLLAQEDGKLDFARVAKYCGIRNVSVAPTNEGGIVAAEMCVDIKLGFISQSGFKRASMTFGIEPNTDRLIVRCTSINIKDVPGEIDSALCNAIKPFEWNAPPELKALKPTIDSATLIVVDGKLALSIKASADPSSATNGEWRDLMRLLLGLAR